MSRVPLLRTMIALTSQKHRLRLTSRAINRLAEDLAPSFERRAASKPTLFRPHRGSLEDAMKEVVEVATYEALVDHIHSTIEVGACPEGIVVAPYHGGDGVPFFDARVGWDTYIVKHSRPGVLGFTNGPLSPKEQRR